MQENSEYGELIGTFNRYIDEVGVATGYIPSAKERFDMFMSLYKSILLGKLREPSAEKTSFMNFVFDR